MVASQTWEPGFPFSNLVVNRNASKFVATKTNKTTSLIKAFLKSLPKETTKGGDEITHY